MEPPNTHVHPLLKGASDKEHKRKGGILDSFRGQNGQPPKTSFQCRPRYRGEANATGPQPGAQGHRGCWRMAKGLATRRQLAVRITRRILRAGR